MDERMTAGITSKSHTSRKTAQIELSSAESSAVPVGEPSFTALTTTQPLLPSGIETSDDPPQTGGGARWRALRNPPQEKSVTGRLDLVSFTKKDDKEDTAPVSTGVPAEEPKKQWWFRHPDSKTRKFAEKIMVMRAAGRHDKEIAKRLKTTTNTVQQAVYVARKNGWLNDEDEPVDTELEYAMSIDRKIVRNVSASLDGQMTNWQTHEMTMAAAKGRGHFKNHDVVKNDGLTAGQMSVVAIQVLMPPVGESDQRIIEENVGGVAAYLEGDIENSEGETV